MGGYAWVTLATNDAYSLGALVLAHSLRRVGTKYELAVLVTPGVTSTMREKLAAVFSLIQEVNVLDSKDEANLALLQRPELGITFTKLHCWRLTQYDKCVFLDADTLVVKNCDELFEKEELSAAPDVGWPDCFNSGVFVFKPSQQTFASITAFAAAKGSFDGGDQGLLNMYFNDWAHKDISKHLPFIYNMCSTATYSYLPAFKQFGEDVRIIHFIGISKPWLQYFDTITGIVQPSSGLSHLQPLLQLWWNIFCENVHPQLSTTMAGLAGALAQLTLGEPRSAEQRAFEEQMRKQSWEQGQIDYMGRDSFDNIWKKICDTLSRAPQRQPSPPKENSEIEKKSEKSKEVNSKDDVTEKSASTILSTTEDQVDAPITAGRINDLSEERSSLIREIPTTDTILAQETRTKDANANARLEESTANQQSQSEPLATIDTTTEASILQEAAVTATTAIATPTDTESERSCCPARIETPEEKTKVDEAVTSLAKQEEKVISSETKCQELSTASITKEFDPVCTLKEVTEKKEDSITRKQETAATAAFATVDIPAEDIGDTLLTEPVPIQVAESVLQTEPKESVSEEAKLIAEEAISSTVAPLRESVVALSETLVESTDRTRVCDETVVISPGSNTTATATTTTIPGMIPCASQNGGDGLTQETSTFPMTRPVKEDRAQVEVVTTKPDEVEKEENQRPSMALESSSSSSTSTSSSQKLEESQNKSVEQRLESKSNVMTEQLPMEEVQRKGEQQQRKESTSSDKGESKKLIKLPVELKTEEQLDAATVVPATLATVVTPETAECPTRPNRTKEMNIPSTPTVIEPTPPTSPTTTGEMQDNADSVSSGNQVAKTAKKSTTKKVIKKASLESQESTEKAEGDGSEKKNAKKVVKKVPKKPKESQEEAVVGESSSTTSSSNPPAEKPKKTAKPGKKLMKPSQTLETDTSVPETPPPATSDTPIPPKRKTKAPVASNKSSASTANRKPSSEL